MLKDLFTGIKGFIVGVLALLSSNVATPLTSPLPESAIVDEALSSTMSAESSVSTSSATLSTPTASMLASPTTSPTPLIDIDLHLESLIVSGRVHSCTSMINEPSILLASSLAIDPHEELERLKQEIRGCTVQNGSRLRINSGNSNKITAGVRNNGHLEAQKVGVRVIMDGEIWWTDEIESIPAGQSKKIQVPQAIPGDFGEHAFEFQVNPDKTLLETRYDNNSVRSKYVIE